MNWLWSFLVFGLPWYVQVAILAVPVLLAFYIAVRILGWERVKPWLVPALGILAALGTASKLKQDGYNARRSEEEKALDAAEDFADDKRHEVQALPDAKLNEKVDKWSRK